MQDRRLEVRAELPEPDVIAAEIAEDLRATLEQFAALTANGKGRRETRSLSSDATLRRVRAITPARS